MSRVIKTIVALCVAPVVGGTIGLLLYLAYENAFQPNSVFAGDLFVTLRLGLTLGPVYGGLLGIIPSLLVGWPLHMAMQRAGLKLWWHYALLGIILAAVAALLVSPLMGLDVIYLGIAIMLMMAGSGAIGGLVFWLIRRPDRDATASPLPTPPGQ